MFTPVSCSLPFVFSFPHKTPRGVSYDYANTRAPSGRPARSLPESKHNYENNNSSALGFTTAVDAPNRITNPKESFVASEGIYTLREEITLNVPPPHPSEPLIIAT